MADIFREGAEDSPLDVREFDAGGRHYRIATVSVVAKTDSSVSFNEFEQDTTDVATVLQDHAADTLVILTGRDPSSFAGTNIESAMQLTGIPHALVLEYDFASQGIGECAVGVAGVIVALMEIRGIRALAELHDDAQRARRRYYTGLGDDMGRRRALVIAGAMIGGVASCGILGRLLIQLAQAENRYNRAGTRSAFGATPDMGQNVTILLDGSAYDNADSNLSEEDIVGALQKPVSGEQAGMGAYIPKRMQVFTAAGK